MALTKVTKSGLANDSVDADKLEDGTIVASDINDGTITNAKLAGSIENAKLANSSITINGSAISLGGSVDVKAISWQSVKTSDFTAVVGEGYFVDTTSSTITATLPASPSIGDIVAIKDYAGTFGTNELTIDRNGSNIQGNTNNSLISTNRASVVLVYVDATKGWLYTNESNVSNLSEPFFTSATGGTVTTDGDYKIHSFTSSGCFVVSTVGNSPVSPTGGPNAVDYLVIGGGGSGVGQYAGGGAGGFRMAIHSAPTTNPLNAPVCESARTITATTYPITIGAGGAGYPNPAPATTPGSPSIFSTITSAGGGSGNPKSGGSGSGANGEPPGSANPVGSGNTPPVSPPQGNPGGANTVGARRGGGGGGAGAAGGTATGGAGSYVPTTWLGPISPTTGESGPAGRYFSGGGGGGTENTPGSPYAGGLGGGGAGGNVSHGTPGTVNTGGGAGSGSRGTGGSGTYGGGNGGSGIIIIKYKFQ